MKMCFQCWYFQPIDRVCLYEKDNPKKVEPFRRACVAFLPIVEKKNEEAGGNER